jgi:hypothetical protein
LNYNLYDLTTWIILRQIESNLQELKQQNIHAIKEQLKQKLGVYNFIQLENIFDCFSHRILPLQ